MPVPTYAVLPSNGRPCMRGCFDSLIGQVDHLFIIRNGGTGEAWPAGPRVTIIDYRSDAKLPIHQWWNAGIAAAARLAAFAGVPEWNTLVVNDDVLAGPGSVAVLAGELRASTADLASPPRPEDQQNLPGPLLLKGGELRRPGGGLWICGWFFLLRGEAGLCADTRFHWWYGDNDLEWQARSGGGALVVPGCGARNQFPGGHDMVMSAETAQDAQLFAQKWPQAL